MEATVGHSERRGKVFAVLRYRLRVTGASPYRAGGVGGRAVEAIREERAQRTTPQKIGVRLLATVSSHVIGVWLQATVSSHV